MLTNKKWRFPEFEESLPSAQGQQLLADILLPSPLTGGVVRQARG